MAKDRGERPARRGAPSAEQWRGWARSLRFSGFSVLVICVVAVGVLVLAPQATQFVQQRQDIAALTEQIEADEAEIAELQQARERWNDRTFVTAQARNRLYYVMPGEVSFIVIDDEQLAETDDVEDPVSEEVEEASVDWPSAFLGSVLSAGGATVTRGTPADDPGDSE